ncbi:MAG TPA: potassium channel family protein [Chloroflexota bacterium]
MMSAVLLIVAAVGAALIAAVLWDGFETVILPRRITRRFRLARFVYRGVWLPWRSLASRLPGTWRRENVLAFFGPLCFLVLLGTWVVLLMAGYGAVMWGLWPLTDLQGSHQFGHYLYFSGTTFFTLGLGDVLPGSGGARTLTVLEAGNGFAFLALMISYLPMLYQAFSRREVSVSLLDARAGSPPTAVEFLRRHALTGHPGVMEQALQEWERWCAELLESHMSYPVLGYFRSQHDHQSWVAALTAVLDASALVIVGTDGPRRAAAQFTFAMARHAAVDLYQVFPARTPPASDADRLPPETFERMRAFLETLDIRIAEHAAQRHLAELRAMYEPQVQSLSHYFLMELPDWMPHASIVDDWQTSPEGVAMFHPDGRSRARQASRLP